MKTLWIWFGSEGRFHNYYGSEEGPGSRFDTHPLIYYRSLVGAASRRPYVTLTEEERFVLEAIVGSFRRFTYPEGR